MCNCPSLGKLTTNRSLRRTACRGHEPHVGTSATGVYSYKNYCKQRKPEGPRVWISLFHKFMRKRLGRSATLEYGVDISWHSESGLRICFFYNVPFERKINAQNFFWELRLGWDRFPPVRWYSNDSRPHPVNNFFSARGSRYVRWLVISLAKMHIIPSITGIFFKDMIYRRQRPNTYQRKLWEKNCQKGKKTDGRDNSDKWT